MGKIIFLIPQLCLLNIIFILLSNCRIIVQQDAFPFQSDTQGYFAQRLQTDVINDVNKLGDNVRNQINNQMMSAWSNYPIVTAANKPQQHKVQLVTTAGQSSNLNFNLFQRSNLQQQYSDQEGSIYTSKLSLLSTLGSQIDSKIMQYVKTKIELNRKMILQQNSLNLRSYMLAENKFIIYTSDEFKEMFLTLQQPDHKYVKNQPSNITVIAPQSNLRRLEVLDVNWKLAKKMTSVKYQKQCGACYAFTTIGAIESAYLIQGQNLNLAEQELIDCSAPYNNYGCIGGWTSNAYKYIRDFGILFESEYPYTSSLGSCALPQGRPKYKIKNYVELSNDCNVVIEALKKQPLSIAINADGWQYYSSGIYTDCRSGASNHGVVLAGVDSTSWLVKNSWGFTWGEQGYIRISRTAPNTACNVCRWASYPVL